MRKKKVIYRKNTPAVLFLLAVICVSGLCLAAVAKDGGLNVESGTAKLIAGAVSGFRGERTEDLPEVKHEEAASDADLNGLSENRTEETKVITNGYETVVKDEPDLSAVFIGSAIAGVNLKDSSAGEEDKPQVVSSAVRETSTDGQTREETAAPPVEGAVLIYHTQHRIV
ncbi:MAG: hypothetical protein Q4C14_02975 [Bacillota bacterium]|nr:hypothetical protein [Bacillota bacterium]